MNEKKLNKNKSNELKLSRVYDAPVKIVWEAWTDPKQVAQWWGPRGFTLTTHSKDLRVGGSWNYTMHGPDGVDYENSTKYFEVETYHRLVYDHGGNSKQPPLFRVAVNFTDLNGKTKMDMTMTFSTAEVAAESKKFIKKAGGDSTWDRLAEYLEKKDSGKEKFVINRTFEAPIELVFRMWMEPQHFSKWLAPTGFNMEFLHADIQTGGSSFYFMTNEAGIRMYGKANYLEVKSPNTLKYTQEFCDENGNQGKHPLVPSWPATLLTTVQFTAQNSEETRVTVNWEPYGNTTPEELETFVKGRGGMTQGWTGSFDKLEDYLKSF